MNNKNIKEPLKQNHKMKGLGEALRKNLAKFSGFQRMKPSLNQWLIQAIQLTNGNGSIKTWDTLALDSLPFTLQHEFPIDNREINSSNSITFFQKIQILPCLENMLCQELLKICILKFRVFRFIKITVIF